MSNNNETKECGGCGARIFLPAWFRGDVGALTCAPCRDAAGLAAGTLKRCVGCKSTIAATSFRCEHCESNQPGFGAPTSSSLSNRGASILGAIVAKVATEKRAAAAALETKLCDVCETAGAFNCDADVCDSCMESCEDCGEARGEGESCETCDAAALEAAEGAAVDARLDEMRENGED